MSQGAPGEPLPPDHFHLATQSRPGPDGSRLLDVPDGWQQGRGAFGGLVVAMLLRAIESAEESPDRRLRTLTADLCGPVMPGEARIDVTPLRRGSGLSCYDARLTQNGEVQARASAVLSKARPSVPATLAPFSPPTPWQKVEPISIAPPVGPVFARHYEYRPTGPLPFTSGPEPVVEGWVRLARPSPLDAAHVAGLLDSFWPALFSIVSEPRLAATVSFTMELLCDPASLPPDEPLFYRARQVASDEGFLVEFREVWTAGGKPVGMNQQTFAVIR